MRFLLLFLLTGCGHMPVFPYDYYGMKISDDSYKGKLIDKNGEVIDFEICKPDKNNKLKCVIMLDGDFYRLKTNYLKLENELIDLK